ncbi:hypothetical protein IIA16_06415 [bacterium]|nr:hypothetical protein [bacterium]
MDSLASLWVFCLLGAAPLGAAVTSGLGRRRGGGVALLAFVGLAFLGAGFKLIKDGGDPMIPAELRPSAWNAVGAFVLGGLALAGAVSWLTWWW